MKFVRILLHLTAVVAIMLALSATVLPAHAATGTVYVVTSSADTASDGECSLPEAVAAANASTTTTDCPSAGIASLNTIHFNLDSATDPGYNGATLLATMNKNFPVGTHGFKKVSGSFTTPRPYTTIIFKLIFKETAGTAWFDSGNLTGHRSL